MLQIFFVDSCSHTLLKERRHKAPEVISFVSVIQELLMLCSHPHLFQIWLLISLRSNCELNCEVKHHQPPFTKETSRKVKVDGGIIAIASAVHIVVTGAKTIADFF